MKITPFKISIPDHEIKDLNYRLKNTRWAPSISDATWEDGTDANYLKDLITYWANDYNWKEREAKLNQLDHYTTVIDETKIHYIYAPGKGKNPIPLLLLHGWPSSFVQMLKIIPLLTEEREDGTTCFNVVIASMPGYPFSQCPTNHGMNFAKIADLFHKLMVEVLNYPKYALRGSDQGGLVQQQMALQNPSSVIGLHRSGVTPFANPLPNDLSLEEKEYQVRVAAWAKKETTYAQLQATRPETLIPGLCDSPVGLASWYLEKFQRWGHCNDIDHHFGKDELLDNLSLHWFTKSAASSIRLYQESAKDPGIIGKVAVPTAIVMPLNDAVIVPAPRKWAERSFNVHRYRIMETGGHFPEWEVPEFIANDVRQFFTELTKI